MIRLCGLGVWLLCCPVLWCVAAPGGEGEAQVTRKRVQFAPEPSQEEILAAKEALFLDKDPTFELRVSERSDLRPSKGLAHHPHRRNLVFRDPEQEGPIQGSLSPELCKLPEWEAGRQQSQYVAFLRGLYHQALVEDDVPLVQVLESAWLGEPASENVRGQSLLVQAVDAGSVSIVRYLLDQGIDLDDELVWEEGRWLTLLEFASEREVLSEEGRVIFNLLIQARLASTGSWEKGASGSQFAEDPPVQEFLNPFWSHGES